MGMKVILCHIQTLALDDYSWKEAYLAAINKTHKLTYLLQWIEIDTSNFKKYRMQHES